MDLFGRRIRGIDRWLIALVNDAVVGRSVIYQRYESETFDESVGHPVRVFTPFTLRAAQLRHTMDSVSVLGGDNIEAGDLIYLIRSIDVPDNVSEKDEIDDAGVNLKIKRIDWLYDLAAIFAVERN